MSIQRTKFLLMTVYIIVTCIFSQLATAEVVVIVNAKNTIVSISKSDLSRIFLGKADSYGDGAKAIPINQIFSSTTRKEFDKNLLRKTSMQIKAYWSKQMFAGNGIPPKEFNGDLDVLLFISQDNSAIGYIDSSALNGSVKVIKVI